MSQHLRIRNVLVPQRVRPLLEPYASIFEKVVLPFTEEPRGTPENRPMRDTSKPANGTGAGQALLYRAELPSGNSFSLF